MGLVEAKAALERRLAELERRLGSSSLLSRSLKRSSSGGARRGSAEAARERRSRRARPKLPLALALEGGLELGKLSAKLWEGV